MNLPSEGKRSACRRTSHFRTGSQHWGSACPDVAGDIDDDGEYKDCSDIGAEEGSSLISDGSSNEALRAVESAQGDVKSAEREDPRPRNLATARADDGLSLVGLDSLETSTPIPASREAASHPAEMAGGPKHG